VRESGIPRMKQRYRISIPRLEQTMAFERRTLGRTGLFVSPFGIGGGYRIDSTSIAWAFEHGINYFFWAPWVPTYRSMERCLKQLLPRHRDEIVIATAPYSWFLPGSIERSVRKHLRRLKIDYIDLTGTGISQIPRIFRTQATYDPPYGTEVAYL